MRHKAILRRERRKELYKFYLDNFDNDFYCYAFLNVLHSSLEPDPRNRPAVDELLTYPLFLFLGNHSPGKPRSDIES